MELLIDIPDESNILNITIECEDNDALNDDECDMNSDIAEWKLFYSTIGLQIL